MSFADTMFFCNSGAEAIEGGIKLIRKYQFMNGKPKRYKIICFQAAFHGRLLNALAATGNEKYLEGFGPPAPGYKHAPLNNTNVVRDMIDDETAGILVEPIQGEGGIRATTRSSSRTCARSATSSACCCSTTRSTRVSAVPARCGATTGRA
jgi:acetylornithine/N-succinyldiaminopimelate aminotransferase